MRILVVDDELDIRRTSKLMLELLKHEVRTAKDGKEALRVVDEWQPDAVLTDLSMPEMDGFLTTRKLRARSTGRAMLIVACSAHLNDSMVRDLAVAAGCDACLTKPLDWERVKALLDKFEPEAG